MRSIPVREFSAWVGNVLTVTVTFCDRVRHRLGSVFAPSRHARLATNPPGQDHSFHFTSDPRLSHIFSKCHRRYLIALHVEQVCLDVKPRSHCHRPTTTSTIKAKGCFCRAGCCETHYTRSFILKVNE